MALWKEAWVAISITSWSSRWVTHWVPGTSCSRPVSSTTRSPDPARRRSSSAVAC